MKFNYKVLKNVKDDNYKNFPDLGVFFAVKSGDICGMENFEDFFGCTMTERSRKAIDKRLKNLKGNDWLLISKE